MLRMKLMDCLRICENILHVTCKLLQAMLSWPAYALNLIDYNVSLALMGNLMRMRIDGTLTETSSPDAHVRKTPLAKIFGANGYGSCASPLA